MLQHPGGLEPDRPAREYALDVPDYAQPLNEPYRSDEYARAQQRVRSVARDYCLLGVIVLAFGLWMLYSAVTMPESLSGLRDLLAPLFLIMAASGLTWILLGLGIGRRSRAAVVVGLVVYLLAGLFSALFGAHAVGAIAPPPGSSLRISPWLYLLAATGLLGAGGVFHLVALLRAHGAIGVLRRYEQSAACPAC